MPPVPLSTFILLHPNWSARTSVTQVSWPPISCPRFHVLCLTSKIDILPSIFGKRSLPWYKKEHNARDYIDSYQLYAGEPGGLTIQADKGKEHSGHAHDDQFQGRKNHS